MLRNTHRRRGYVIVVVAISLIAILGALALTLDGGLLMDRRRAAQSSADASALAAADDLYLNWWANQGLDPTGTARRAAAATAAANGFADGENGCTVEIRIPPTTGPSAGLAGHVEVVITAVQPRYFSRIFGTEAIPVGARAIARGRRSSITPGIIVLAPSGKGAFSTGGGGNMTVSGAPVIVNSNDVEAMYANGGGTVTAPEFRVGGIPGWSTPGGGTFSGPIVSGAAPTSDPLAQLPPPDPAALTVQRTHKLQISNDNPVTLSPGVYVGGITITGQGNVTLSPGVYYMQGGGFSWGGQGSLTGTGVMIYNAPDSNSDAISLTGQGTCNLSPAASGPYQGVLLFQNRTATAPVGISGNGNMTLTGAFYAPAALLAISGNGANDVIGAQYISYQLSLGGNGSFGISWTASVTPGTRDIYLVE